MSGGGPRSHPGGGTERERLERLAVRLAVTQWVTPDRVREAVAAHLTKPEPVSASTVLAVLAARARREDRLASPAEAERVHTILRKAGARVLLAGHDGYPRRLAQAWPELGAPVWLFLRGQEVPDIPAVAVVGTRRPTLDGLRTARELGRLLAEAGVLVVSGLARGIDQAAHRGALDGGGPTVAVLGSGFGVDYPAGAGPLRRVIAASGALLTEYAPGTPPVSWHFLWRNRIIGALADVTVVVEGRERSGALATARLAAAQGREVLAVPGSLHAPQSRGPLALIRDGARPVTRLEDVLEALGLEPPLGGSAAGGAAAEGAAAAEDGEAGEGGVAEGGAAAIARLEPRTRQVLGMLGAAPATVDALATGSGLPVRDLLAAAAELESLGLATATPTGLVRTTPATAPSTPPDSP